MVVDGNDPGVNGDALEALLDTEVAGGIAPKANISLYTAANTDLQMGLLLAIARAIDDNQVSVLNVSFGVCEANLGTAGNQFVSELMEQAAAQGISVTVSSGDSGSAGCDSDEAPFAVNGLAVNGLASSPYTVAVGGTDFPALSNNFSTYVQDSSGGNSYSGVAPYYRTALSYIPESPWNDSTQLSDNVAANIPLYENNMTDIVAGGGGASNCAQSTSSGSGAVSCQAGYSKPPFQSSLTPADGVRDLPDVSFLAANGLYGATWAVCADNVSMGEVEPVFTDCQTSNGQLAAATTVSGVGGTSAAAPTFAGILALAVEKTGSRLGQPDYVLYQLANSHYAAVFHDTTAGDNSVVCSSGSPNCGSNGFLTGYNAASGYDQASGLGSVDAAQMVNNWDTVSLASTTTSFNINGSAAPLTVQHGTTLTFNVGVSPSASTGAVSIVNTANQNTGGPLNNGQLAIPLTGGNGTATYNGLPGGTYQVFATYSGDVSDAASTSAGITVTVSPEASTTGLTVNAYSGSPSKAPITNLASIPYGSYLFEDAQISGTAEGANTQGVATGTVSFLANGSLLASAAVSVADQASIENPTQSSTALSPGSYNLSASYAGDSSFNPSTSTMVPITIVKAPTTLAVNLSGTTISSLASELVQAFINFNSVGALPTGTITISDNGTALVTFPVVNATAGTVLAGSSLAAGQNAITVTYSGDSNYLSSSVSRVITMAEAGFTLTNNGPLSFTAGAASGSTATIHVVPQNGFVGVVNLSCAVTAPAGASNPATCSVPATVNITSSPEVAATLTIGNSAATSSGSYSVIVTGVDMTTGKITAQTTIPVTVDRRQHRQW